MTDDVVDYTKLLRLDGKGFVVLGAGNGIGVATSRALASAGAKVFCVDIDKDLAEKIAKEVDGFAGVGDLTNSDDVARLFAEAEQKLGQIDGLADIVGIASFHRIHEFSDEDYDWQDKMVARQAFYAVRAAAPYLEKAGGGSMVFIASTSGLSSAPNQILYGMSKAAVMSMMRSAAVELGPKGIRVNTVSPGATKTPRIAAYTEVIAENIRRTPLRKVGEVSDIASAILFLSSPLAGHISGQNLTVDGGITQVSAIPGPGEV